MVMEQEMVLKFINILLTSRSSGCSMLTSYWSKGGGIVDILLVVLLDE